MKNNPFCSLGIFCCFCGTKRIIHFVQLQKLAVDLAAVNPAVAEEESQPGDPTTFPMLRNKDKVFFVPVLSLVLESLNSTLAEIEWILANMKKGLFTLSEAPDESDDYDSEDDAVIYRIRKIVST